MDVFKRHGIKGNLFPFTFVITGGQLYGNLGSAAMSIVTLANLREKYPSSRITFLSKYPTGDLSVLKKIFPDDDNIEVLSCKQFRATFIELPFMIFTECIYRNKLKPSFSIVQETLQKTDVIIDIGGITFSEERGMTGLTINATWLLLGSIARVSIVKLSQAFGPFKTNWFKWISKLLLSKVNILISRGSFSTKELKKLSLKNQIFECSDLAFLLKPSPVSIPKEKGPNSRGLVFGIAPSSVLFKKMGGKKYIELIVSVINNIFSLYKDSSIFLIVHSFRKEKTLSNNDAPVCEWIYKKLSPMTQSRCRLISDGYTPAQMRSIIGYTDIFLSCRFHAMIGALSAGVPVGVIGWSHKYREVQNQFGVDFCIDQSNATPEKISCLIRKLVNNRTHLREQIRTRLPEVTDSARKNFEILDNFIEKNAK